MSEIINNDKDDTIPEEIIKNYNIGYCILKRKNKPPIIQILNKNNEYVSFFNSLKKELA